VCSHSIAQHKKHPHFAVIGYYGGRPTMVDSFPVEKLTHLIFSFTHLRGSHMRVSNAADSLLIRKMVALKSRNPSLKIILSMGGWSGCQPCSEIFSSDTGRKAFAASALELLQYFGADGVDLDWEYPVLPGFPGHAYSPSDKDNFTALITALHTALGKKYELSFAAGGFAQYIEQSIDWKKVMPQINRVNLMTYDLVGGYATVSGHHTPLYSTPETPESVDHAVTLLRQKGVPAKKIAIGAAFYARIFENSAASPDGLHQPTKFRNGVSYRSFATQFSIDSGYVYHWDATAQAPFYYRPEKKWFVSLDDSVSIRLKTKYALKKKLNGIMFWQLADDRFSNGLLDVIDANARH